jgi:hypothetical protein
LQLETKTEKHVVDGEHQLAFEKFVKLIAEFPNDPKRVRSELADPRAIDCVAAMVPSRDFDKACLTFPLGSKRQRWEMTQAFYDCYLGM